MDATWREENDWIHRDSQNRLQQPLTAIHTCPQRYLRPKTECSADSVRMYFMDEIEPKLEQMKSIEPDAKLMTKNLNILFRKSFVSLEQHNKTIWTYKAIQQVYDQMRHDVCFHHRKSVCVCLFRVDHLLSFFSIEFQMTEFENLQREKINVFQRRLQFATERCRLLATYNQKVQADVAVAIKKCVHVKWKTQLSIANCFNFFDLSFQSHQTNGDANY